MSTNRPDGLVIVDGRVTDEKLVELLGLQAEHPELDFKRIIEPGSAEGLVKLSADIGAMSVLGGYLVGGVDGNGLPTGEMDGCDERLFDEARLSAKLRKYLPEPITIRSRVADLDSRKVVVIYVGPHPDGYAVFHTDGQYEGPNGKPAILFRAGEIWWREGTSSTRMPQAGMEQVIARRVAAAKNEWIVEQQEIRRREREEIEAGYAARDLAKAPLGTLHFGLSADELVTAVLELLRADDRIALQHLLKDASSRSATAIGKGDLDELDGLLGKVTAIGAVALEYDQDDLFRRVVATLTVTYSMPLGPRDDHRFSLSTGISRDELAPRVFLAVIEHIYGLGALAVRLGKWEAVRGLTLQRPDRMDDYWNNWLVHALVMAARAHHLEDENGSVSLLSRAAAVVEREPVLRSDMTDTDAILTSLARFDFLQNLVAVGDGGLGSGVYYPNWARFYEARILPIADRLLRDGPFRQIIFGDRDDPELANALAAIGKEARREGIQYSGFWGWDRTPVGDFIAKHTPAE